MIDYEKCVLDYIDARQGELFLLLSHLIRFDTQNFITSGREKECQEFIAGLYRKLGLETDVYSPDSVSGITEHPDYLPGRGLENRPNVTGVLTGSDPEKRVMIAAHTDTMPAGDPGRWTEDPFGGVLRDGCIFGLGSGDDKFGIAAGYFALKALKETGVHLKKTVILTAYADEEYGGGDGALAACLRYPCDTYVNLDGSNWETWVASLGGGGFEIEVKTGFSTDTGSPVIDALYAVQTELERMGARRTEELNTNPLYAGSDIARSAYRLIGFSAGNRGSNLDSGKMSFMLYTDRPRETILDELDGIIRKLAPEFQRKKISTEGFKPTTRFFHSLETPGDDPALRIFEEATNETGSRATKRCGACLSDLSIFLRYGSASSFNFGIKRSISEKGGGHQPDEFVECDSFLRHTKALALFLIRYGGIKP